MSLLLVASACAHSQLPAGFQERTLLYCASDRVAELPDCSDLSGDDERAARLAREDFARYLQTAYGAQAAGEPFYACLARPESYHLAMGSQGLDLIKVYFLPSGQCHTDAPTTGSGALYVIQRDGMRVMARQPLE